MHTEVILSKDGSNTLFSKEFGVTYHSLHGSIQESMHVFISAGLDYLYQQNRGSIRLFEMGFGSGLNAILALQFAQEKQVQIDYHGIEAYPISMEVAKQLNYSEKLALTSNQIEAFKQMHGDNNALHFPYFEFNKYIQKLEEFKGMGKADLIFYDAFAPSSQQELWEAPMLQKMYDLLDSNSVLVTYCAKGEFKRLLKKIGFEVEALSGPANKREMTRAFKR
jgi:tRNA U34 5-methylaminomethyl-2-thiouridine-forming methyltransferase MnmC